LIDQKLYERFLDGLLRGDRHQCRAIVVGLVEIPTPLQEIYLDLFQRAMVEVGELWQRNHITVATEHLATSITESLLPLVYPLLFHQQHLDRHALITCVPGEYHQIGVHMVADFFELFGWHGYSLGSNTPRRALLDKIDEMKPDLLGLSATISFNLPVMEEIIEAVEKEFPGQRILVGGHALARARGRYSADGLIERHPQVRYVRNLDQLKAFIDSFEGKR
jgi:methanogenic corrinoid protein MtbC1